MAKPIPKICPLCKKEFKEGIRGQRKNKKIKYCQTCRENKAYLKPYHQKYDSNRYKAINYISASILFYEVKKENNEVKQ